MYRETNEIKDHEIRIVDGSSSRYLIEVDNNILGHLYDNKAETITVIFPEHELELKTSCTMTVSVGDKPIDRIQVEHKTPIYITNVLSRHRYINICFSFKDNSEYVKNSNLKEFRFAASVKPDYNVDEIPEYKQDLSKLIEESFTNVIKVGDKIIFENIRGDNVGIFYLQDLTFLNSISVNGNKIEIDDKKNVNISVPTKTSELVNDGYDVDSSPYITQNESQEILDVVISDLQEEIVNINEELRSDIQNIIDETVENTNSSLKKINEWINEFPNNYIYEYIVEPDEWSNLTPGCSTYALYSYTHKIKKPTVDSVYLKRDQKWVPIDIYYEILSGGTILFVIDISAEILDDIKILIKGYNK